MGNVLAIYVLVSWFYVSRCSLVNQHMPSKASPFVVEYIHQVTANDTHLTYLTLLFPTVAKTEARVLHLILSNCFV